LPHVAKEMRHVRRLQAAQVSVSAKLQDLRRQLDSLCSQCSKPATVASTAAASSGAVPPEASLNGIIDNVRQVNDCQKRQWVPFLNQLIERTDTRSQDLDKVTEERNDWWLQPAQFLVNWMKLDGKDVNEVVRSWRALSMQLR